MSRKKGKRGKVSTLDIGGDARVFGAVLGRTVELRSNAQVHFDEALLDDGPTTPSRHTIAFWKEVVN